MNYIGGISDCTGKIANGLTIGYDILINIQYGANGKYFPGYVKPVQIGLTISDGFFIGLGEYGGGLDIGGMYIYSKTGGQSPYSVSPTEAVVDGVFIYLSFTGLPGIIVSGIYYTVVRPVFWQNYQSNFTQYISPPNIDNTRVNIPMN